MALTTTTTRRIEKAVEPDDPRCLRENGQPLPLITGYPLRVIVPGLYGEKERQMGHFASNSSTLTRRLLQQQGWGPNFVVPTSSRFDQPDDRQQIKLATASSGVGLKGVAHGGERGVSRVEVSADEGRTWQEAKVDRALSPSAWSLWSYEWHPNAPGEYKLAVRATDARVAATPMARHVPEGETGYLRSP